MGLTHRSVGTHAAAFGGTRRAGERIVALAGNPNVGKSTVFNALTRMRQHTGNWAGKTVGCACGRCRSARGAVSARRPPGHLLAAAALGGGGCRVRLCARR